VTDQPNRHSDDDLVPEDDAVIGRAFRWSVIVIIAVGVIVTIGFVVTRDRDEASPEVITKEVTEVAPLFPDVSILPEVTFTEESRLRGIDFIHESGARGEKYLPETMGSGVAFLDVDLDSDQDLLLINGRSWDEAQESPSAALLLNDGAGNFSPSSPQPALKSGAFGQGVAVGDFDGDGDSDLFLPALGYDRLLRNDDGTFIDVTAAAGVAGGAEDWSTSAAFLDFDRDGDLDLFVCTYVEWSAAKDRSLHFTLNGTDRAYGPPTQYAGTTCRLYRNEGDGRFGDVSEEAGIEVLNSATGSPVGKALAVLPCDVNGDGWIDLVVANDTVRNFLFLNRGNGTFDETGIESGLAFDDRGMATGAMGIDAAHYRNDATLGIGIGNFANEMTSFYVGGGGDPLFADEAILEGVGSSTRLLLSFGLFFFDYDLDGRLDLFQTNGHLENEINEIQASQHYRQPAQLFWNRGGTGGPAFEPVPASSTGDLATPIVGRSAAFADVDGDGDLDIIITQPGDRPLLLINQQELGHHWIRLSLLDGDSDNRAGLGAWIDVTAGGETQRRHVMPTCSYLAQAELPVTFGLGERETIDAIVVTWPDGEVQSVDPTTVGMDRESVITRAAGSPDQ
jgi:hypothetical protein